MWKKTLRSIVISFNPVIIMNYINNRNDVLPIFDKILDPDGIAYHKADWTHDGIEIYFYVKDSLFMPKYRDPVSIEEAIYNGTDGKITAYDVKVEANYEEPKWVE